jgi:16S rRNA (adenine1518-N6/adenine1519-N6)-dimethyltransferase
MVAEPGSGDFGRLSVMLQVRFYMERLFIVPPGSFNPPPKVDSAVVRMIPKVGGPKGIPLGTGGTAPEIPARFAELVAAAFSQRRKMLRNTLRGLVSEEQLTALGIAPTARAEELAVDDYLRLAASLNA